MKLAKILCNGCLGALLMAGCASSPPIRYYTLSAQPLPATAESVADAAACVVAIAPVALADYLNHPFVTVRSGDHLLSRSEYERWGGSFRDTVTRAVAGNLTAVLTLKQITVAPASDLAVSDYRLGLSVDRFERAGTEVVLQGSWLLTATGSRTRKAAGPFRIVVPVGDPEDTVVTVTAMSQALEQACDVIAGNFPPLARAVDAKTD